MIPNTFDLEEIRPPHLVSKPLFKIEKLRPIPSQPQTSLFLRDCIAIPSSANVTLIHDAVSAGVPTLAEDPFQEINKL